MNARLANSAVHSIRADLLSKYRELLEQLGLGWNKESLGLFSAKMVRDIILRDLESQPKKKKIEKDFIITNEALLRWENHFRELRIKEWCLSIDRLKDNLSNLEVTSETTNRV